MSKEAFAKILDGGADMAASEPAKTQEQEAPVQPASNETPSFSGELGALFREGLKDLQNVVLHAFPDSARGVEEPGTPLNPTQQMVTDSVVGNDKSDQSTNGLPTKEVSLQDILDAPSPITPQIESSNERDQGREM